MTNTRSFPRTCPTLASYSLSRSVKPGKGRWEDRMLASAERKGPLSCSLLCQQRTETLPPHVPAPGEISSFLSPAPILSLPPEGAANHLEFWVQVPGMKMSSTPLVLLSPLLGFLSSRNSFSSAVSSRGPQGRVGLSALPQEKPEPARHAGGEVELKLHCGLSC